MPLATSVTLESIRDSIQIMAIFTAILMNLFFLMVWMIRNQLLLEQNEDTARTFVRLLRSMDTMPEGNKVRTLWNRIRFGDEENAYEVFAELRSSTALLNQALLEMEKQFPKRFRIFKLLH